MKTYGCLKHSKQIKSIYNEYIYYMTRKKIIITNSNGGIVKKIDLPKTMDNVVNSRILEFYDMYYSNEELLVIIRMLDYYDCKSALNEELLELGELTPYK